MKAMVYTRAGSLDELEVRDLPKPKPEPGQVLIHVKSSSLNIGDYNRFASYAAHDKVTVGTRLMDMTTGSVGKPLGGEVAGTVAEIGEGVTGVQIGDEVLAPTLTGMNEGWAEYALADRTNVCHKPERLSFEKAAVIPVGGITAMGAVKAARIHAGQEVLVYGASGGVGQFALQLAHAAGATVTAVVSTRNVGAARQMGAECVIDYKHEDFTQVSKTYDAIIAVNGYNPLRAYRRLLRPHGTYIVLGNAKQGMMGLLLAPIMGIGSGKSFGSSMYANAAKRGLLHEVVDLVDCGLITPYVERSCSIRDVRSAITDIVEHHAKGKTAVTMDFS